MIRYVVVAMMCLSVVCKAQENSFTDNPLADSLKQNLERSTTAAQKVFWLGELSMVFMGVDKTLSDEYSHQQQTLAEASRDRALIIQALLTNAQRHYNFSSRQDFINKGREYSQKALDMAKSNHLDESEAWAYIFMATGSRLNGDGETALKYNNLALSIANTLKNDSLKIDGLISIARTYINKDEKMLALRHYLQALELAEISEHYDLMHEAYRDIAGFYMGLKEYEKAKDYTYKIIRLTLPAHRPIDRLNAYNRLGRIYSLSEQYDLAGEFFNKALALADTMKLELIKINTYVSMLDMYLGSGQEQKALEHLQSQPEVRKFMIRSAFGYYIDQCQGVVYMKAGKTDSAKYYLKKAEAGFEQNANRYSRYWFYYKIGKLYDEKKDYKQALVYYMKAKDMSIKIADLEAQRDIAQRLDSLYQRSGDFKTAYAYNRQYQLYKDSLEKLATEKDLMLMEVDNEKRREERAALQAEERQRARHNIQYMGITVAIACIFIVLVMLGIFRISHTAIRILGFFAFIFLFEFIILIADNQIHHWTHGEPWKVLAIKIGLISLLLPLHHYLEEKVIHYLTSRKLLELNKEMILSKFTRKGQEEVKAEAASEE